MKNKKEKIETIPEEEKDINEIDESAKELFWDDLEPINEQNNNINENSENSNLNINNLNMPKKPKKSKKAQKEYEAKLLINYIGKNYQKILKRKFSFAAFFFGGLYLIYRKIYLLGMLLYFLPLFLLNLFSDNNIISIIIVIVDIVISAIIGMQFNKKYSEKAYNDCMDISEKYDYVSDETIVKLCRQKGGTSIGLTIVIIIFISAFAIPAALLLKTIIFFASSDDKLYEKDISQTYTVKETISESVNSEKNILSFNNNEYEIAL